MSLPRYPKYKASGVEWLGEVPEHWQVRRLKHVCEAFPSNVDKKAHEGEQPVLLCNYTDVYYNDLITSDLQFMSASASVDQIEKFTLRAGDTVITKDSETADDIAVSAHVPADLPGVVCGYHLSIVRPRGCTPGGFVKRLFDSAYTKAAVAVKANGLTRVGLSQYDIDNIEWPWPPPDEQRAITSFLDRETSKIDALIAEQQRLVELLKEKRQAVISHAVTKGLNPDVAMKPSGVEGLGAVPAHWDVSKMKWVAKMETGHTPDKKVAAYWEGGSIPWVSLNDTGYLKEHNYIADTAFQITQQGIENSSAHLIPSKSVVFSRDATIGRCAITTRPMAVSQHFIAWVCNEDLRPEYLLLRLRTMANELNRLATGATVKTIGMPEVRTLITPVPPATEQDEIVSFVAAETAKCDLLADNALRAIELLRERRSALVSSAVTGKIDVRDSLRESVA